MADDGAWRDRGPSPRAISQFGIDASRLRRLAGGAGLTWCDGRIVVKPVGHVPEHEWVCDVFAAWTEEAVRVPRPLRPRNAAGAWSVDGWGAHLFVPGRDADTGTELSRIVEVNDAFHACVALLPRPDFLDDRDDPWAYGDRLAWENAEPLGDAETLDLIEQLRAVRAPVTSPSQVVHGDILPNVLLARDHPPAVIDWPPYFRPVTFARAVLVTDAVTFRAAPLSLLDECATGPDWPQVLIRALLYRLGPTAVFALHRRLRGSLVHHVRLVRPVVAAAVAMT